MSTLESLLNIVSAERLNADGVPSASIALLEDGKISAKVISSGKEDTNTIYQACSISKAITALAVAKLVDDGHFTYDTPVANIVNCVVEPATAHLMQHVTVRMLLSHTSGLSQGGFPGYTNALPSAEDVLSGEAPSNTPKVHFTSFPSAQFSYSGGGFTVLQLFLEQVTQMSFPELMETTVLKPLGMIRSHYGSLPSAEEDYATAHHTAYTVANEPYHHFIELAAAGLWTTPTDMLSAISAVQDSLHTKSGFLKQETAKTMLTQRPQTNPLYTMALGWGSDDSVFAHRGSNDPGYNCYAFGSHGGVVNASEDARQLGVPPRNGLVIMTNSVLGFGSIQRIVSAIFYLEAWPAFGSLAGHFGKDDYVPFAVPEETAVDEGWKDWSGEWHGGDWQLLDDGGPRLVFREFSPMRLRPAAAPFRAGYGWREHFLVVDGLGTAVRLTWSDNERVVELLQTEGAQILKRV